MQTHEQRIAIFRLNRFEEMMRFLVPILKTLALVILTTTLWYLAFWYMPASPGFAPPIHVFIIDNLNLIVHEAGHFFFRPLGTILYFMGGSIFQILFPFGIGVFVFFKWHEHTVYPLFLTGWNMCDVAVYISDAPFKMLHLIGKGTLHDWNFLMTKLHMMDDAVLLGAIVHWSGVLTGLSAIGVGVYYVIQDFHYS